MKIRKRILKLVLATIVIVNINKIYALSEDFIFTIETVGIPRYNSYGKEISEDVYIAYNIFAYSEPHNISSNNQRWKNSKYGYWAKGKGRYTGSGTRGEYYVIGYTYSGEEIFNYYFPMDSIPTTTPDKWTFYSYPIAESSWQDITMYKYEEQLTHMLKSKLMFNDLSSTAKANNPKYIKEYNITAEKIGKKKARLETAATWRTFGMISTRRKISGVIYKQVYLVKPMAADAEVKSTLEIPESNVLSETQDELLIPIKYSVNVLNMTGYANEKHIKEIKASIYIDDEKVDEVSGSKIISVGSEYMLVITREKIPPTPEKIIEIKVDGYMHTEFAADGLMRDVMTKNISIKIEPKLIHPIENMTFSVLEKQNNTMVVRPLAQNIETKKEETIGFIEAGKSLAVKLDLAVDNVEKLELKLNEMNITYKILIDATNKLILEVKIPENIETTLYGETSLREDYGSYFNINKQEIGKRKNEPYALKIIASNGNKEYIKECKIDVLDTFISNMNTQTIVTNKEEIELTTKLAFWLDG
ncbi:MAG: hypothetical protein IKL68_01380 [Clostridia bacterium]|nr:hypothetical protein [Clostridia bacterium]